VSERRFNGWEPAVLHEHYDAAGAFTGCTVIVAEPEWDETARARAEALVYLDDTTCGNCGGDLHRTLTPDQVYDVATDIVCYSCRALELVRRDEHKRHSDDVEFNGRPMYLDGRIYTVREMSPAEVREVERHG